jgi:PLP dependent protein
MIVIADQLSQIKSRISAAESKYLRLPGSVQLLAVSKTKSASTIAQAYKAGQRQFGESYLQEALVKQQALSAFNITWHFIGPIQSNKTKQIANHFHWVHSVDRLKIAHRLSEQRSPDLPPLNICLQVNISHENTKSGIDLQELPGFIEEALSLQNIIVRGVMAIPAPETEFARQCLPYRALYEAVKALNLSQLDTFSFGMSDDLEAAIKEGSTIVRIGTALFGERN